DRWGADPRFDPVTRWQAEWNLARALQAAGRQEIARARVGRLRSEAGAESRPPALRARMAWLEARLARESGDFEAARGLARAVWARLAGVEAGLRGAGGGRARLVEAEALCGLGRAGEAMTALRELRSSQPNTEAALQSLLVEAEHLAAAGRLVDA